MSNTKASIFENVNELDFEVRKYWDFLQNANYLSITGYVNGLYSRIDSTMYEQYKDYMNEIELLSKNHITSLSELRQTNLLSKSDILSSIEPIVLKKDIGTDICEDRSGEFTIPSCNELKSSKENLCMDINDKSLSETIVVERAKIKNVEESLWADSPENEDFDGSLSTKKIIDSEDKKIIEKKTKPKNDKEKKVEDNKKDKVLLTQKEIVTTQKETVTSSSTYIDVVKKSKASVNLAEKPKPITNLIKEGTITVKNRCAESLNPYINRPAVTIYSGSGEKIVIKRMNYQVIDNFVKRIMHLCDIDDLSNFENDSTGGRPMNLIYEVIKRYDINQDDITKAIEDAEIYYRYQ